MPEEKPVPIEEVIASLKAMIKVPATDEELRRDLDRYLNRYLMDLESSKRAIVKDYGGTDSDYVPPIAESSAISDLMENDIRTVSGVVISEVVRRKPRTKELMEFVIADATGSMPVTIWEPIPDVFEGRTYTFANCRVKFRNRLLLELNGDQVRKYEGPRIVPVMPEDTVITDCGDLSEGMTDVSMVATVQSIKGRSSNPRAPRQGGMLSLGEGTLEFAHWGDYELEPGATYVFRKVKIRKGFNTPLSATLPDENRARKVD